MQLSKINDISYNDYSKTVSLRFAHDDVLVRIDEYDEDKVVNSYNDRSTVIAMWVGDSEMGLRVIRAFKQLGKLCKERTKGEPF